MSFRIALAAGALLASLTARPLVAQQSSGGKLRDTSAAKAPTVHGTSADSAVADLNRALAALALSVQNVVEEAKKNPEVRRAALQTASTAVSVAQKTLEENRTEIERLLAEASRKLAAIDLEQKQKAKTATPNKPER